MNKHTKGDACYVPYIPDERNNERNGERIISNCIIYFYHMSETDADWSWKNIDHTPSVLHLIGFYALATWLETREEIPEQLCIAVYKTETGHNFYISPYTDDNLMEPEPNFDPSDLEPIICLDMSEDEMYFTLRNSERELYLPLELNDLAAHNAFLTARSVWLHEYGAASKRSPPTSFKLVMVAQSGQGPELLESPDILSSTQSQVKVICNLSDWLFSGALLNTGFVEQQCDWEARRKME